MQQIASASSTPQGADHWYHQVYTLLCKSYGSTQIAHEASKQLLQHFLGYDLNKHVTGTPLEASPDQVNALFTAIHKIEKEHTPIPYLIGYTHFMGHMIEVNPHVLIPRSETEEMTASILLNYQAQANLKVLDLCTGSGCIAIALAKGLHNAKVRGIDIEKEAIKVAQKNSRALKTAVHWQEGDIFQDLRFDQDEQWDIIVSNPPYIPASYQSTLDQSVRAHEPSKALFVPDADPLRFHRRIIQLAHQYLVAGGALYIEIESRKWQETDALFACAPLFKEVTINLDIHGKKRWISAVSQG